MFANFDAAKAEAETQANKLTRGDLSGASLSSAEQASFLRARQLLEPTGCSLELAAAQFAEAYGVLGGVSLIEAEKYYQQRHPVGAQPQAVADVIAELLKAKKQDGLSIGYLRHLGYDLDKFAASFQVPINRVAGTEIDVWLRSLDVSPRTRNNLRTSVQTLFSFAKARRYLPKDHDELSAVPLAKDRGGIIEIFTPEELASVLDVAKPGMIAFLTLAAFAGIGHAEIQRLDWTDIHFDDDLIEIKAAKAKTASRRTIPLLPNLKAWLLPYAKTDGPVCAYKNVSKELTAVAQLLTNGRAARNDEPFLWKHNGLRHSYISYRVAQTQNVAQVALEAGNSPQTIFQNYRELVRPAAAKSWFSISPPATSHVVSPPFVAAA